MFQPKTNRNSFSSTPSSQSQPQNNDLFVNQQKHKYSECYCASDTNDGYFIITYIEIFL